MHCIMYPDPNIENGARCFIGSNKGERKKNRKKNISITFRVYLRHIACDAETGRYLYTVEGKLYIYTA